MLIKYSKNLHVSPKLTKIIELSISKKQNTFFCPCPTPEEDKDKEVELIFLVSDQKCKACKGQKVTQEADGPSACLHCAGSGFRLLLLMPLKIDNQDTWYVQWKDEMPKEIGLISIEPVKIGHHKL